MWKKKCSHFGFLGAKVSNILEKFPGIMAKHPLGQDVVVHVGYSRTQSFHACLKLTCEMHNVSFIDNLNLPKWPRFTYSNWQYFLLLITSGHHKQTSFLWTSTLVLVSVSTYIPINIPVRITKLYCRTRAVYNTSPWMTDFVCCWKCCRTEWPWKATGLEIHRLYLKDLGRPFNNLVKEAQTAYFAMLISSLSKKKSSILFDTINNVVSTLYITMFFHWWM